MDKSGKPRLGQISWKEGEREALIAAALAKGHVSHIVTGEAGVVQSTSPWRKRLSSDKQAPTKPERE